MTINKVNYIYKNEATGEYFKSVKHNGQLVLSNPSYSFFFLFETQAPLVEVGSAKKFGNLVKKEDYEFYDGNEITVEVENGNLKVSK